jgi:phage-related protein
MLPKIVDGLVQIVNGLIPYIPQLIETLLPALLNGTVALIRGLVQSAPTFITTLAEMLPTLITEFVNMFVEVAHAFAEQAPVIMPIVVDAIIDALIALFDNIDVIIEACLSLVIGLTNGIIQSLPVLIERLPEIIESIMNAIIDLAPMLVEAGIELIPPLVVGIVKALPQIFRVFETLVRETIPNTLANGAIRLWEAGKDIIKGIWDGIKSFDIVGAIKKLAQDMLNGMKKVLGIHSPSTEFAWLGEMSMKGYTDQVEDMKGMLDDVIESTFSLSPQLTSGDLHYSPNVIVNNNITSNTDSLGQTVTNIKTFANGAKNDYNYGMGV